MESRKNLIPNPKVLKSKKKSIKPIETVKDLVYFFTQSLEKKKNILNPRQEADEMVAFFLKCKREEIYLHFEKKINQKIKNSALRKLKRRLNGEPLHYILEKKFFYKHDFFVNSDVLIPRLETEELVRATLQWIQSSFLKQKRKNSMIRILDLGTGSGCIGLSLLKEIQNSFLVGVDASKKALRVAQKNAKKLKLENRSFWIHKKIEDLKPKNIPLVLKSKFDCILANPPYIPSELKNSLTQNLKHQKFNQTFTEIQNPKEAQIFKEIEKSVFQFEPHEALFAPKNGMEYLISWSKKAFQFLDDFSFFALEIGNETQLIPLKKQFQESLLFHRIFTKKDLFERKRLLCAERKSKKKIKNQLSNLSIQ